MDDFIQKHHNKCFYDNYGHRPLLCVGVWGGFYKQVTLLLNCMLEDFHAQRNTA